MEKVLNIAERLEDKKRKQQIADYRNKFEAVQRIIQCSVCRFRCAMCGLHVKGADSSHPSPSRVPEFNLCESCRAEFEDFLKISKKEKKESEIFWHNKQWLELWTSWLNYQQSIGKFRASIDFKQLTEENHE